MMLNLLKFFNGDSCISKWSTTAFRGPFLHHSINLFTASLSPSIQASTDPSSQFRTVPLTHSSRAFSNVD